MECVCERTYQEQGTIHDRGPCSSIIKERERSMQLSDQLEREPKGPTPGPLRPVFGVMETTEGEEEPRHNEETSPPQGGDEQDRLPPITEKERRIPPPAPPQPEGRDEPEPVLPPRDPRPLSLPVAAARPRRPLSLLIAVSLGISVTLLGIAVGILLAVNPTSLGPVITWLPGVMPTASVTLTPAQESLHTSVSITAVIGTPDPSRQQVSARLLSGNRHTFTQTEPPTQHVQTVEQNTQGTLHYNNAAPHAQAVAAGTDRKSTRLNSSHR